jgi:hypothetical protein
MSYIKSILSVLAALIIAQLLPGPWSPLKGINGSKATGVAVFAASLVESMFSPLFWMLAIALFAIFFTASRLENKALRVAFFWIPTLTVSSVGFMIASLVAYLVVRFRNP